MKLYSVGFLKNEVYQTNLVKTEKSPVDVGLYYKDVLKATSVYSIDFATADDMRPGKPVIEI